MRFKGDIIITDPIYVCKRRGDKFPESTDYFSYEKESDYPDYKKLSDEEIDNISKTCNIPRKLLLPIWIYRSEKYQEEKARYEEAISHYKESNVDDWELCNRGEDMGKLGLKTYICTDTLSGDWSCSVFNSDTGVNIGNFCSDSSYIGVFLLDEVMKYNPDFKLKPGAVAIIKNFDGEVDFEIHHEGGIFDEDTEFFTKGEKWEDDSVFVVGRGNINFTTWQTGF